MLGRILRWLGSVGGGRDGDALSRGDDDGTGGSDGGRASDDVALDLTDPDAEYGGDGPRRRYTCSACGDTIEGTGPDSQLTCPTCETVFKGVLVPDAAVCPDCGARIEDAAFYPETRRDTEFATCGSCGYHWESDPR
jgi:DNA-directed RNA polymerase subunit RPC12/RpoP